MSRLGVSALLVPALFAAAGMPATRSTVLVVSESGVDAYGEALSGAAAVLPAGTFRVIDAAGKSFERELSEALGGGEVRVAIALGSRSLAGLRAHRPAIPVVAAMGLDGGESEPGIRRVNLDIPLAAQLAQVRQLWPGRTRAAVIRNPAQPHTGVEALEALARKEGFSLVVVDCDGPARLLKAFAGLKGKADFVLCLPDPELYNPVTVKPLVMASLEQRLPLIGYSPAFVRAGAAAGVFADYTDAGRQAAEMALRLLRGDEGVAQRENPRRVVVAMNQRVARLLGIDFHPDAVKAEVYR